MRPSSLNLPQNRNKQCIIIASGPSILNFDFRMLDKAIDVFCVNGAIDVLIKKNIRPDYYCVVDTGFLTNRKLFLSGVKSCKYLFTNRDVRNKALIKLLFSGIAKYILIDSSLKSLEQSIDERKFIEGGTVVSNAIQIALMMKYKIIYIAGMDLDGQTRAYSEKITQPSYLDKNFHSIIEPFFKELKKYSEENGIRIYNLSVNSRLSDDIIKKIESINQINYKESRLDDANATLI